MVRPAHGKVPLYGHAYDQVYAGAQRDPEKGQYKNRIDLRSLLGGSVLISFGARNEFQKQIGLFRPQKDALESHWA